MRGGSGQNPNPYDQRLSRPRAIFGGCKESKDSSENSERQLAKHFRPREFAAGDGKALAWRRLCQFQNIINNLQKKYQLDYPPQ